MAFKTCCGTIPPQREIWFADTETSQSQRAMHSDLIFFRGCPSPTSCHGADNSGSSNHAACGGWRSASDFNSAAVSDWKR